MYCLNLKEVPLTRWYLLVTNQSIHLHMEMFINISRCINKIAEMLLATVLHPIKMLKNTYPVNQTFGECSNISRNENYVTTSVPYGLTDYYSSRGPLKVYLGSKTMESTSLLQSWEKEVKILLLLRVSKLQFICLLTQVPIWQIA